MGSSRKDSRHMAGGSERPMSSTSNHMPAVTARLHLRYPAMACERPGSPPLFCAVPWYKYSRWTNCVPTHTLRVLKTLSEFFCFHHGGSGGGGGEGLGAHSGRKPLNKRV